MRTQITFSKKRIITLATIILLICNLLSFSVSAADEYATLNLSADRLNKYDIVYIGSYDYNDGNGQRPLGWKVLGVGYSSTDGYNKLVTRGNATDETVAGEVIKASIKIADTEVTNNDALFLYTQYIMGYDSSKSTNKGTQYDTVDGVRADGIYSNWYHGSNIEKFCNNFADNVFDETDDKYILSVSKGQPGMSYFGISSYNHPIGEHNHDLVNVRVFPISAKEIQSNFGAYEKGYVYNSDGSTTNVNYWLRSGEVISTSSFNSWDPINLFVPYYDGDTTGHTRTDSYYPGVRPCTNLYASQVLTYISQSDVNTTNVSKYALKAASSTVNEWKLILKDDKYSVNVTPICMYEDSEHGNMLYVNYNVDAEIEENLYLSAVITDKGNRVLSYGKIIELNSTEKLKGTEIPVNLPVDFKIDDMELKFFVQKCVDDDENNAYDQMAPDYASEYSVIDFNSLQQHCFSDGEWLNETEHIGTCEVCGTTKVDVHTGGQADCTKSAECSVCGEYYGELGDHKFNYNEYKSPNCTDDGRLEHFNCIVCNKLFGVDHSDIAGLESVPNIQIVYEEKDVTLPAYGHSCDTWSVDDISHWHECKSCKAIYDKEPHEFGEIHIIEQPTEKSSGLGEKTCKVCEKVKSVILPKLDSDNEEEVNDDNNYVVPTGDNCFTQLFCIGLMLLSFAYIVYTFIKKKKETII